MSEFKVGDVVKIIETRRSALPNRFLNRIVTLTSIDEHQDPDRTTVKFYDPETYWNWRARQCDIELVMEMNRNGANE